MPHSAIQNTINDFTAFKRQIEVLQEHEAVAKFIAYNEAAQDLLKSLRELVKQSGHDLDIPEAKTRLTYTQPYSTHVDIASAKRLIPKSQLGVLEGLLKVEIDAKEFEKAILDGMLSEKARGAIRKEAQTPRVTVLTT